MMKINKLVQCVGIRDIDITKQDKCYITWNSMLQRCYSKKRHLRQPSYIGCTVCEEWLIFSTFKKWFDCNHVDGFELDKDILIEGNKVYSPDTCRFIPAKINTLLVSHCKKVLPLGVTRNGGSYQASCRLICGKRVFKTFKTVEEASTWYSEAKKNIVKEEAQRAFLANEIKSDVYLALIRRNF